MAAIAKTAVSLFPAVGPSATATSPSEWFSAGLGTPGIISRRLKITTVTAGDTATAAVLGLSSIMIVSSGYNGTTPAVVTTGIDPVNNRILIGSGPASETIYLTVTGVVGAPTA